jgi:hypothetical protein
VTWGGLAAIALASPALGLRTGQPLVDAPYNLTAVQAEFKIQQAFPPADGKTRRGTS